MTKPTTLIFFENGVVGNSGRGSLSVEVMSSFASDEHLVEFMPQSGTGLQDQVSRLFEEARDDVYRYLLTLGLHPPQAQEATQEVFLRLYTTLRKGEEIQNPRA